MKQESSWQTHYKFSTFIGKTCYIYKSTVQTWEDLLYAFSQQTDFQYNHIEVVINSQKVDYQRETLLVDIDFDKEAPILVLKRDQFKTDKQKATYQQNRNKLRKKCQEEIEDKYRNPQIKKSIEFVLAGYSKLLTQLSLKYKRLECLVAIYACKGDKEKTIQCIQSGRASKDIRQIQKESEKKKLVRFFQERNIQQLQRFIEGNRIDQMAYRGIMQKLYEAYPFFKELQFKHRRFVKKYFYGKSYHQEPNRQQDDNQQPEKLKDGSQKRIIVFLKSQEKAKFAQAMELKGFKKQEIHKALFQSLNNLEKARYILENGLIDGIQSSPLFIKKAGRINFLLQFFANPKFDQIREKLKDDRPKAQSFLDWVALSNKDNPIATLIKKNREEALALLTGSFVVEKKKKTEQKQATQVNQIQLTQAEQKQLKDKIKNCFNKEIARQLMRKDFDQQLAESIARAAGNQKQKLELYQKLKGVLRNFETASNDKSEQKFIQRKLKQQHGLLQKLTDQNQRDVWLASISETTPFLFASIVRNFKYFTNIVYGRLKIE